MNLVCAKTSSSVQKELEGKSPTTTTLLAVKGYDGERMCASEVIGLEVAHTHKYYPVRSLV